MPNSGRISKSSDPYYYAQTLLSYRDHSVHEMREKLTRKGFAEVHIDETISQLITHRLLDDAQFVERYVTSTLRKKAVGPRWISYKLKQKGIASELITQTLDQLLGDAEEVTMITTATRRWRERHPKYAADRQRLARFLISRGFSPPKIRAALDHLERPA